MHLWIYWKFYTFDPKNSSWPRQTFKLELCRGPCGTPRSGSCPGRPTPPAAREVDSPDFVASIVSSFLELLDQVAIFSNYFKKRNISLGYRSTRSPTRRTTGRSGRRCSTGRAPSSRSPSRPRKRPRTTTGTGTLTMSGTATLLYRIRWHIFPWKFPQSFLNIRAEKRVRNGKASRADSDELWKNMLRSDDTPKKTSDKVGRYF